MLAVIDALLHRNVSYRLTWWNKSRGRNHCGTCCCSRLCISWSPFDRWNVAVFSLTTLFVAVTRRTSVYNMCTMLRNDLHTLQWNLVISPHSIQVITVVRGEGGDLTRVVSLCHNEMQATRGHMDVYVGQLLETSCTDIRRLKFN